MKLIVAMIDPERVEAVQAALYDTGTTLLYASEAGDLREHTTEMYRGLHYRVPKARIRLEAVVINEMRVHETVDAIAAAASEGGSSQCAMGNIMVLPLDECIPVRAQEGGFAAVMAR